MLPQLLHELWQLNPFLIAGSLLLLYVTTTVVYHIYFHPLSKYPGPFLGRFSDLVIWGTILGENRTPAMYDLMKKHGSPMRISTDQLIFSDSKSWVDINGQHSNPFLKEAAMEKIFTATGAPNVLNAVDRQYHARLRRLLSANFSSQGILKFEPMIVDKVENLMNFVFLPGSESGGSFDIFQDARKHYLDIISQLTFGTSFNCTKGENPTALSDLDQFLTVVPANYFFPGIKYLPIPAIQEGYRGLARLIKFSRDHVADYIAKLDSAEVDGEDARAYEKSFLRNLVTSVDEETGTKLSFDELVENAIIFLVGGSGTTAVVTVYFIWECARNPETRKRLVDEIRTAFPDPQVMPTYEKASKLPLFNSMIQETLRLWGPLSNATARVSPGRMVSGHFVPRGMLAATLSYATARDPDVFPDPETFKPERFLAPTADMKAMSRPFLTGPRNCIGKHLAEIQLTLTLARIFQLYNVEIDPSTTVDDMKLRDRGVMEPWGGKLLIRVTRAG